MRARSIGKAALIGIGALVLVAALITGIMAIRLAVTSNRISDDYSSVLDDPTYQAPVSVQGITPITQEISCGYAIIEMLATWHGQTITEQALYEANGQTISTAMGTGFLDEVSKRFPTWSVTRHTNLTNSDVLTSIHASLSDGMPVPIEFAALQTTGNDERWTLHFAVVTGLDVLGDAVTVQNPYGYEEHYTIADFLAATRYDSYVRMELGFRLGFAYGLFHKNTIYTITE